MVSSYFFILQFIGLLIQEIHSLKPCIFKDTTPKFLACVCNSTYCDEIEEIGEIEDGTAILYTSTAAGKRLEKTWIDANFDASQNSVVIKLGTPDEDNPGIIGFGGAFTDAFGYNLNTLPKKMREKILEQYFSENGLNYNLGRVPIASTDFSTRIYSYAERENDFELKDFQLTEEDNELKIPFIKKSREFNPTLRLFSTAWSPPGWMKTNNNMTCCGTLKPDSEQRNYSETFAKYLVGFFEEYAARNVTFWGMTVLNEPETRERWQVMRWTPQQERDFLKDYLGPEMKRNPVTKDIVIMILDDNTIFMQNWTDIIMKDKNAAKYVDGIGIHWYRNENFDYSKLSEFHQKYPKVWMLGTEACIEAQPALGDWNRAQRYAEDIIKDLNNKVSGWVDWNLAVDMEGGPNWAHNYVDAPIIVNSDLQEYYKQPIWYIIGHFSKFIDPGSKLMTIGNTDADLEITAFQKPNGIKIAAILNKSAIRNIHLTISGYSFTIERSSMSTVIFK